MKDFVGRLKEDTEKLVDLFIAKGANCWDSALLYAVEGGHEELFALFIEKGALPAFARTLVSND